MELIAAVTLVFLALIIGWVGLILGATWLQIRDEADRAARRSGP